MTSLSRRALLLASVVGAMGIAAHHPAFAQSTQIAARNHTITVGNVSDDPKKSIPKLEAMAGYLAHELSDSGIESGKAIVARDNEQMIKLLMQGDVDVVSETVFSAVDFATRAGAEILLWEWKNGVDFYNTIIFVPTSSNITSLEQLRGKTIAFEDAGSTSGFLMPLAGLRQHGLQTVEVAMGTRPASDSVGYFFAGDETNITIMVKRGVVDAGVSNSEDWEDFLKEAGATAEDFTILYEGHRVMRSALLVRPGMDPAMKQKIVDTLLKAADDESATEVLKKYNKVKKYEMVAGAAADSLAEVRNLYPLVASEIR